MSRIAENPMARPLFQRGTTLVFQSDPKVALMLTLAPGGELGAQLYRAEDPALQSAPCRLTFDPEDLASVARGGQARKPPDVAGADQNLARQVLLLLGIQEAATQRGPGAAGPNAFEMSRSMVLDAQLSPDRQTFAVYRQSDAGAYDVRHWRVETGVTHDGWAFAVSVGLTDPNCPIRQPPHKTDPRQLSGCGHELVLFTHPDAAKGGWSAGMVAAILRDIAQSERPFYAPDWIDYKKPLFPGGTTEGFLVVEAKTMLESPFSLHGGTWGRFYVLVGLTRHELRTLDTQKEPRRIQTLLSEQLGNCEITDPWRESIRC